MCEGGALRGAVCRSAEVHRDLRRGRSGGAPQSLHGRGRLAVREARWTPIVEGDSLVDAEGTAAERLRILAIDRSDSL